MNRYLIIDLTTGRHLVCVMARTPAAAKAMASKLIGWGRPDFRGAVEIGGAA